MSLEIVRNHDGHASSLLRTGHGGTDLLAKHISSTSGGNAAIKPAITPVQQAKAVDFAVIPRRLNQTLSASSFSRPDTREGRVKGHLHLILQVQIRMRHQWEQISQVGGKLIPQVSLNQIMDG
jgi:hypothetical protein